MIGDLFGFVRGINPLAWIILFLSFLLGSIPFGLIVARLFKVKGLTQLGSGNIGATNVSRVVGFWPAGLITFLLDMMKGVLSVLLASQVGCQLLSIVFGMQQDGFELSDSFHWATGLFSVLGHCFSPWLQFRGGKGVSTTLGVILVLSPISALCGICAFFLTFFHKKTVSLSSIAGLCLATVAYLVINSPGAHMWVGAAMVFLVLIRHEANIDALLENREKTFMA